MILAAALKPQAHQPTGITNYTYTSTGAQVYKRTGGKDERSTDTKIYKHNNTSTWVGHNGILPRCRTSISAPRQIDKKAFKHMDGHTAIGNETIQTRKRANNTSP